MKQQIKQAGLILALLALLGLLAGTEQKPPHTLKSKTVAQVLATTTTTTEVAPTTTTTATTVRRVVKPKTPATTFTAPTEGVQAMIAAKFGPYAQKALAIARCESGFNPRAHNGNPRTGDNSYGLFQINMYGSLGPARMKAYGLSSYEDLFDPQRNIDVAFSMSRGGVSWAAWGCN